MKIYIGVTEAWNFYVQNRKRLTEEEVLVAGDERGDCWIYLTDCEGHPRFLVEVCGVSEAVRDTFSEPSTEQTLKWLFAKYLFPFVIRDEPEEEDTSEEQEIVSEEQQETDDDTTDEDAEEEDEEDLFEMIDAREEEIYSAFTDFLKALVIQGDLAYVEDLTAGELSDALDQVLEDITFHTGIPVYRPTFVTDEDTGEDRFVEYPYEDTDLDE